MKKNKMISALVAFILVFSSFFSQVNADSTVVQSNGMTTIDSFFEDENIKIAVSKKLKVDRSESISVSTITNMTSLTIKGDVENLKGLERIRLLRITFEGSNLSNQHQIELYLGKIDEINIEDNKEPISDFSGLNELNELGLKNSFNTEYINLGQNVETLKLNNTNVIGFDGAPNLNDVNLSGRSMFDISELNKLDGEVSLYFSNIEGDFDFSDLSNSTSIIDIGFDKTSQKLLDYGNSKVEYMAIYPSSIMENGQTSEIDNLERLANFTNVSVLVLSDNVIKQNQNFDFLKQLTNINILEVYNNNLNSNTTTNLFENITYLEDLEYLSIMGNEIFDLRFLNSFKESINKGKLVVNMFSNLEYKMSDPGAYYEMENNFLLPESIYNDEFALTNDFGIYLSPRGIYDKSTNLLKWQVDENDEYLKYIFDSYPILSLFDDESEYAPNNIFIHIEVTKFFSDAYKVSYVSESDTVGFIPVDDQDYFDEDEVIIQDGSHLTREGFTFKGWEFENELYNFNDSLAINQKESDDLNIILQAKWEKNEDVPWVPIAPINPKLPDVKPDEEPKTPVEKEDPTLPMTGVDNSNYLWSGACIALGFVIVIIRIKSSEEKNYN